MDHEWQTVKKGIKPSKGEHLKLDTAYGASLKDVERLFEISLKHGASDISGKPLHPDRHQVEQSTIYVVLDNDHADRPMHSMTTHSGLVGIVAELFGSELWKLSSEYATHHFRAPYRLSFHFPTETKTPMSELRFVQTVKSGASSAATVVIDVDASCFLYVVTVFPNVDLPPDIARTAGENPCFDCTAAPGLVCVLRNGKLCPEVIGMTTYLKGEFTAVRSSNAPSTYQEHG